MKNYIVVSMLLIGFTACHVNKKDVSLIVRDFDQISISKNDTLVDLDYFVDSVEYIKLETTSLALISKIDQLLLVNDTFVISTEGISPKLLLFSKKGRFIRSISHIGKGPGEYRELTHIGYCKYVNKIFIYDIYNRRLSFFNLNGSFVSSLKAPYNASSCEFIDENTIVFCNSSAYNPLLKENTRASLIITDLNMTLICSLFPRVKNKNFHYGTLNPLINQNGTIYFNQMFSDTIYKINSNCNVNAEYVIDLQIHPPPQVTQETTDIDFQRQSKKYNRFKGEFFDLGDMSLVFIKNPRTHPFAFYNKQEKRTYLATKPGNRALHEQLFKLPLAVYQNQLFCDIPANVIYAAKKLLPDLHLSDDNVKSLQQTDISDNPIIVVYHIQNKK